MSVAEMIAADTKIATQQLKICDELFDRKKIHTLSLAGTDSSS